MSSALKLGIASPRNKHASPLGSHSSQSASFRVMLARRLALAVRGPAAPRSPIAARARSVRPVSRTFPLSSLAKISALQRTSLDVTAAFRRPALRPRLTPAFDASMAPSLRVRVLSMSAAPPPGVGGSGGNGAGSRRTDDALMPAETLPQSRAMSLWLMACGAAVFCIVVIGGATRLTKSGLSMVDWRPEVGSRFDSLFVTWLSAIMRAGPLAADERCGVGHRVCQVQSLPRVPAPEPRHDTRCVCARLLWPLFVVFFARAEQGYMPLAQTSSRSSTGGSTRTAWQVA
jgi:hypothetical protein